MAKSTITAEMIDGELVVIVNGADEQELGRVVVNEATFTADIRRAAMFHGFKQKLVDAAALPRNEETGRPASPVDKLDAIRDVFQQLVDGDWNKRATGDGTAGSGLLVVALMRLTGKDRTTVEATVDGWTKEQQAAMRASAQVAPIIAQIKAERAAKKGEKAAPVDVSGLLGGLGIGEAPVDVKLESHAAPVGKAVRVRKDKASA